MWPSYAGQPACSRNTQFLWTQIGESTTIFWGRMSRRWMGVWLLAIVWSSEGKMRIFSVCSPPRVQSLLYSFCMAHPVLSTIFRQYRVHPVPELQVASPPSLPQGVARPLASQRLLTSDIVWKYTWQSEWTHNWARHRTLDYGPITEKLQGYLSIRYLKYAPIEYCRLLQQKKTTSHNCGYWWMTTNY